MRCSSKHITLPFLAIALLIAVSLACSPTGAVPGGGAQGQPTAQATSSGGQPTAAAQQPTSPPKQPTPTTASAAKPGVLPEVAELKSLSSYRSTITSKGTDATGTERVSVITTEWVKDPPAQHVAMKDGDKVTGETITIGAKSWMYTAATGWREVPPQPERPSDLPSDLEGQIKKMQSDLSQAKPAFTLLGAETIDGIRCKHYQFDLQLSLDMPQVSGGTQKATLHSSGEMWVADQTGLPAIIIQSKEVMEMDLAGRKTTTQGERKVFDINQPITIKPPEGAQQMPLGPTPSAGKTPQPTSGAQPPASQGQPTAVAPGKKIVNVTVLGTDVIYLAGRTDVKIPPLGAEDETFPILRCSGDQLETLPASVAVSPGAKLTFKATGEMDFWGGTNPIGPDGEAVSAIDPVGGMSGYTGPQGALVGVFLDEANPKDKPAPDAVDMESLGTEFATFTPALGQVFFIGDGLTGNGSGNPQTFVAPSGATRLFLGIADGSGFGGQPGCYGDNIGAYQVQVNIP